MQQERLDCDQLHLSTFYSLVIFSTQDKAIALVMAMTEKANACNNCRAMSYTLNKMHLWSSVFVFILIIVLYTAEEASKKDGMASIRNTVVNF